MNPSLPLRRIRIPQRSKYGVDQSDLGKAARTYKNVLYDSVAEKNYACELDVKQRAGLITKWERQINVPLFVNHRLVCSMRLDFRVHYADGRTELHDVKGMTLREWEIKRRLYEALTGEKIRVIKPGARA